MVAGLVGDLSPVTQALEMKLPTLLADLAPLGRRHGLEVPGAVRYVPRSLNRGPRHLAPAPGQTDQREDGQETNRARFGHMPTEGQALVSGALSRHEQSSGIRPRRPAPR